MEVIRSNGFMDLSSKNTEEINGGLAVTMGAMAIGAFIGKKVIVTAVGKKVLVAAGVKTAATVKAAGATAGMAAGAGWANSR